MIIVNGKMLELPTGQLLADFLLSTGFEPTRVVVELNGVIVPRASYQSLKLTNGDTLEVVTFVGGG